tara:strand:- start:46 stop:333 length:288 start_codon:yes stop_codon:yes gene_type:complete
MGFPRHTSTETFRNYFGGGRSASELKKEEGKMALYSCDKCGMSVGTMTCGHCSKELVHDSLVTDDGAKVFISRCPDGHGKVKSPLCCGQDMSCPV